MGVACPGGSQQRAGAEVLDPRHALGCHGALSVESHGIGSLSLPYFTVWCARSWARSLRAATCLVESCSLITRPHCAVDARAPRYSRSRDLRRYYARTRPWSQRADLGTTAARSPLPACASRALRRMVAAPRGASSHQPVCRRAAAARRRAHARGSGPGDGLACRVLRRGSPLPGVRVARVGATVVVLVSSRPQLCVSTRSPIDAALPQCTQGARRGHGGDPRVRRSRLSCCSSVSRAGPLWARVLALPARSLG